MRRRTFLVLAALGTLSRLARAQTVRRVGWLVGGSPKSHAKLLEAFRAGLKEHGWVEGKNLALELRWAEGDLGRLPVLAADLVGARPEVIVTAANVVHLAVKKETATIPIVMATGADPVGAGLVASLARPGTNVTGLSGFFEATPFKMLELAFALVPRGARIMVLLDGNFVTPQFRSRLREEFARTAQSAGLRVEFLEVVTATDVWRGLGDLEKNRPAALVVLPGSMIYAVSGALVKRAEPLRVPVIYPFEESVEAGGLMSYHHDIPENVRRAPIRGDKILRGAKPGDLPIEQPDRFVAGVELGLGDARDVRRGDQQSRRARRQREARREAVVVEMLEVEAAHLRPQRTGHRDDLHA